MLTLISSQKAFEEFVETIDWHDGHFLESHTVRTDGRGLGTSTLRIFADASFRDKIEFVFYEPDFVRGIEGNLMIEYIPEAIVKRRLIEFAIGDCIEVRAACMAYRRLSEDSIKPGSYFGRIQAYDDDFNLISPYNIDWRTLMDEASIREKF